MRLSAPVPRRAGVMVRFSVVVVEMATGSIIRFDDLRGYGFIAPAAGGEDIFFHANDFGEQRRMVRPGLTVDYEVTEGTVA
ncbi:cold shock domain-containing protein [Streptomyces sp. M19]